MIYCPIDKFLELKYCRCIFYDYPQKINKPLNASHVSKGKLGPGGTLEGFFPGDVGALTLKPGNYLSRVVAKFNHCDISP